MKVINIWNPYDLESMDIENDEIDVFVDTDDGYTYTLSLGTPKNSQFLMDTRKMDYTGPGYPPIFVTKLTPEIIEETIKAFSEENNGYWLKFYHFGGCSGYMNESIFDQIKSKHLEKRKDLDKELDLMGETKHLLKNSLNKTSLIYLVEQYQSGNTNLGIKTRVVPETCLSELRVQDGTRLYFQEENDIISLVAIIDKDNQTRVIERLKSAYPKKNNL